MTPIQLDIIRTFGSKELSEGCLIEFDDHTIRKIYGKVWKNHGEEREQFYIIGNSLIEHYFDSDGILGHIPELFPCVHNAFENDKYRQRHLAFPREGREIEIWEWYGDAQAWNCIEIRYNPTLSLLDQDEQLTLLPLLNLFK